MQLNVPKPGLPPVPPGLCGTFHSNLQPFRQTPPKRRLVNPLSNRRPKKRQRLSVVQQLGGRSVLGGRDDSKKDADWSPSKNDAEVEKKDFLETKTHEEDYIKKQSTMRQLGPTCNEGHLLRKATKLPTVKRYKAGFHCDKCNKAQTPADIERFGGYWRCTVCAWDYDVCYKCVNGSSEPPARKTTHRRSQPSASVLRRPTYLEKPPPPPPKPSPKIPFDIDKVKMGSFVKINREFKAEGFEFRRDSVLKVRTARKKSKDQSGRILVTPYKPQRLFNRSFWIEKTFFRNISICEQKHSTAKPSTATPRVSPKSSQKSTLSNIFEDKKSPVKKEYDSDDSGDDKFVKGEKVQCRLLHEEKWMSGYIDSLDPLMVKPVGWESSYEVAEVKKFGNGQLDVGDIVQKRNGGEFGHVISKIGDNVQFRDCEGDVILTTIFKVEKIKKDLLRSIIKSGSILDYKKEMDTRKKKLSTQERSLEIEIQGLQQENIDHTREENALRNKNTILGNEVKTISKTISRHDKNKKNLISQRNELRKKESGSKEGKMESKARVKEVKKKNLDSNKIAGEEIKANELSIIKIEEELKILRQFKSAEQLNKINDYLDRHPHPG